MAGGTKIEWCDATFNPWWGCERVSPGCAHCYADTLAKRFVTFDPLWGAGHAFRFFSDKHWQEPLKWARTLPAKLGRRPRVFCASMADVFEERDELDDHRDRLLSLICETPELDWLILTKRPEAARDYLIEAYSYCGRFEINDYAHDGQPLPNVWLGVSIENARFTWRADALREIPAAVRFISAEPLLGSLFPQLPPGPPDPPTREMWGVGGAGPGARPVESGSLESGITDGDTRGPAIDSPWRVPRRVPLDLTGIDWVIVGGESGPGARPFHLEHAREIIDAAAEHSDHMYEGGPDGPAVFVKQLGAKPMHQDHPRITREVPLRLCDRKGGDWSEWPADLRIREFPRSAA
jgi:protein gp37